MLSLALYEPCGILPSISGSIQVANSYHGLGHPPSIVLTQDAQYQTGLYDTYKMIIKGISTLSHSSPALALSLANMEGSSTPLWATRRADFELALPRIL
jgi:hypothetical protein